VLNCAVREFLSVVRQQTDVKCLSSLRTLWVLKKLHGSEPQLKPKHSREKKGGRDSGREGGREGKGKASDKLWKYNYLIKNLYLENLKDSTTQFSETNNSIQKNKIYSSQNDMWMEVFMKKISA
jgi:hypothetical protein